MTDQWDVQRHGTPTAGEAARAALLAGLPVDERRLDLAGVPTAVLEGGDGPPLVLLHGPGESAVNWRWVMPDLVGTHRVVAPDLPAHGRSLASPAWVTIENVLGWLGDLIGQTCSTSPVVVGHVIGGAIAARFAARRGAELASLVLVDTLGLGSFRPSARFALAFAGFQARPNAHSYARFFRQCAFDADRLRGDMGDEWDAFVTTNVEFARSPEAKAAGRLFREVGLPRIPHEELTRIAAPTVLIWGRHDRANRLKVAETASRRYGWPLHIVDDAADDPARDRPRAFVDALRLALG